MSNISPIDTHFLEYLHNFIQNNPKYQEVCNDREPIHVEIAHVSGIDYTIIQFKDDISVVIPKVYSDYKALKSK